MAPLLRSPALVGSMALCVIACAGGAGGAAFPDGDGGGGADGGEVPGGDGGPAEEDSGTGGGGAITPIGDPHTGRATYYNADGSGNCSFPASTDRMVAAVNAADYAGSAICGACLSVTGPDGKSIVVRAVDQCPECPAGALDLSKEAFSALAAPSVGVLNVTWRTVACPVTGPVRYLLKDGSSAYYTSVQVRNHRVPIAKVAFEVNGAFVDAPRASYNYFVLASGVKTEGPFRVRVTSVDGATLTDTLPTPSATSEIAGATNF